MRTTCYNKRKIREGREFCVKTLGYYNGKFDEIDRMMIPMNDRVCYFGDGIYEATICANGVIFSLEEHLDRLYNSAGLLSIKIPYTKAELSAVLTEMSAKVDAEVQFVYWQITRGTAPRNHTFPEKTPANLWITVTPQPMCDLSQKIRLITVEDTRFLHCNIKTLNLLPSVMASQKAKQAGCDEAVFHRDGRVTECAHSNVSILKDGIFKTAPTDHYILAGIARAHLIKACKKLLIPVDETPFSLEELRDADEIIVSSSSKFGLAAYELDGAPVGGGDPERLHQLQEEVLEEFYQATGYRK